MPDDLAQYYLTANPQYRHKKSMSSSDSSFPISVPHAAALNPSWSIPTTPEITPVLPPAILKSQDSLVVPTPPLRLPTRDMYPNKPVFAFLWREYDLGRVSVKNAVRNIRDLVDDQTPARSASKRPRRTERDLIATLWVEGPRRTDAIVRYYKAKARVEKIRRFLSDLHAKYEAESPQTPEEAMPSLFSPTQAGDTSPLTPLPSPLPTIALPDELAREASPPQENIERRSKRLQARAAQKRPREDDCTTVASEELVSKPPLKRIRLKQSSNHPVPESEVTTLKTPVSATFKGKENALDLTLD
ncbi:hypothetical protein FRC00_002910 [Tulasnella sp. 408]|nr:hypothetical protein FRC00_002910 [Tulasnella sp. 408]